MSEPRLLTFVTGNLNKLKEFQAIFGELSNTILRHEALDGI